MNAKLTSGPGALLRTVLLGVLVLLLAVAVCWVVYRAAPKFYSLDMGFIAPWLLLGLLPGAIIGQHALLLGNDRGGQQRHTVTDKSVKDLESIYESEFRRDKELRTPQVLLARFGIPAICTVACALIVLPLILLDQSVLRDRAGLIIPAGVAQGIRFGGLGAYVYVLQHLGQRYFQRDITTGGSLWCAVNLVLGPLLGALLSEIWTGNPQTADPVTVTKASVFFLAGLSPRFMIDRINDMVRKTFISKDDATTLSARTLPLTLIRGITSVIEERLYEEGVFDLFGLAEADPFRLMRRTPYDKRQIASWIDEALLATYLPDSWMALEREGITGASDLAAIQEDENAAPTGPPPAGAPPAGAPPAATPIAGTSTAGAPPAGAVDTAAGQVNARIAELAKSARMEPTVLAQVIRRMAEDSQVRLVWGLYQVLITDKQPGDDAT